MARGGPAGDKRLERAVRAGRVDEVRAGNVLKARKVERAREAKRRVRAREREEAERRLAALLSEGEPPGEGGV